MIYPHLVEFMVGSTDGLVPVYVLSFHSGYMDSCWILVLSFHSENKTRLLQVLFYFHILSEKVMIWSLCY